MCASAKELSLELARIVFRLALRDLIISSHFASIRNSLHIMAVTPPLPLPFVSAADTYFLDAYTVTIDEFALSVT